jgi:hypothetical protein
MVGEGRELFSAWVPVAQAFLPVRFSLPDQMRDDLSAHNIAVGKCDWCCSGTRAHRQECLCYSSALIHVDPPLPSRKVFTVS